MRSQTTLILAIAAAAAPVLSTFPAAQNGNAAADTPVANRLPPVAKDTSQTPISHVTHSDHTGSFKKVSHIANDPAHPLSAAPVSHHGHKAIAHLNHHIPVKNTSLSEEDAPHAEHLVHPGHHLSQKVSHVHSPSKATKHHKIHRHGTNLRTVVRPVHKASHHVHKAAAAQEATNHLGHIHSKSSSHPHHNKVAHSHSQPEPEEDLNDVGQGEDEDTDFNHNRRLFTRQPRFGMGMGRGRSPHFRSGRRDLSELEELSARSTVQNDDLVAREPHGHFGHGGGGMMGHHHHAMGRRDSESDLIAREPFSRFSGVHIPVNAFHHRREDMNLVSREPFGHSFHGPPGGRRPPMIGRRSEEELYAREPFKYIPGLKMGGLRMGHGPVVHRRDFEELVAREPFGPHGFGGFHGPPRGGMMGHHPMARRDEEDLIAREPFGGHGGFGGMRRPHRRDELEARRFGHGPRIRTRDSEELVTREPRLPINPLIRNHFILPKVKPLVARQDWEALVSREPFGHGHMGGHGGMRHPPMGRRNEELFARSNSLNDLD
ncbi:hypothetical protein ABKN59_011223 [Abortiporus biennis]